MGDSNKGSSMARIVVRRYTKDGRGAKHISERSSKNDGLFLGLGRRDKNCQWLAAK